MNIFLLGNGFDLHHKFPTAYIDFLNTVNYLSNVDNCAKIKTIYDVFGDEELQSSCRNIKRCVEQHEVILKEVALYEYYINYFKEKAKSNLWFKYLSKILNKDLGWIDFEREIASVIEAFRYFFNHIGKLNQTVEDERNMYIALQFSFFSGVEKDFFNDCAFWDVDEVKDEYRIEVPIGSGILEINKTKIIDKLYEELEELSEMLKTYLELFVKNVLQKLNEFGYYAKNPSYPRKIDYVFTFNYTHTVEMISHIYSSVVHIHGSTDTDIILGVNPDEYDESNNMDTSFIKFKKYYQRIISGTDSCLIRTFKEIEDSIEKNEVHLYVVGHSLDVTDRDIILKLFELAKKITIFYHDKSVTGNYTQNLVKMYGKEAYDVIRDVKEIEYLPYAEINWSV